MADQKLCHARGHVGATQEYQHAETEIKRRIVALESICKGSWY